MAETLAFTLGLGLFSCPNNFLGTSRSGISMTFPFLDQLLTRLHPIACAFEGKVYHISDRIKKARALFYLGLNTSGPTPPMHESRRIDAGFICAGNPDKT